MLAALAIEHQLGEAVIVAGALIWLRLGVLQHLRERRGATVSDATCCEDDAGAHFRHFWSPSSLAFAGSHDQRLSVG